MRFSINQYKLKNGLIINSFRTPKNAILWNGYDYKNQRWVLRGKEDTRTLYEIRKSREKLLKNLTIKDL